MEVEEVEPHTPALRATLSKIRAAGIHCVFGKWLIPGAPFVILFDIGSAFHRLAEWKTDLWNIGTPLINDHVCFWNEANSTWLSFLAGVPSPENDTEMNDSVVFGYLVAWFLGEVLLSIASVNRIDGRSFRAMSSLSQHKKDLNLDRNLIWMKFRGICQNLWWLHTFMNGLLV